ncbi:MAG: hypothetical protein V3U72_04970 [Candidatus Aenigmarchaeota archaeon]
MAGKPKNVVEVGRVEINEKLYIQLLNDKKDREFLEKLKGRYTTAEGIFRLFIDHPEGGGIDGWHNSQEMINWLVKEERLNIKASESEILESIMPPYKLEIRRRGFSSFVDSLSMENEFDTFYILETLTPLPWNNLLYDDKIVAKGGGIGYTQGTHQKRIINEIYLSGMALVEMIKSGGDAVDLAIRLNGYPTIKSKN